MKMVGIAAAIWVVMSPAAIAQQGGYPASPSHGVVGTPAPDGSLRYGNEPAKDASKDASKDATSNPDTVGRNGRNAPDGRNAKRPSGPANNASGERPERAGNPDRR
jgi:hypothetical protein